MTDIRTSDVMRFISYVREMPIVVYHLARSVIHGTVKLYDLNKAADFLRDEPKVAARYDFVGVLASANDSPDPIDIPALLEDATTELVNDFYASIAHITGYHDVEEFYRDDEEDGDP